MKIPIEPERMNPRKIRRVVQMLEDGGVVAYPTDTVYGLGADMFERKAVDRIYRIKGKHEKSPLSFVCNDIKDISRYTIVSDHAYRLMRRLLPGPYTFILKASREVPRVMTRGTRTLGIRIPDHPVARGIVEELGHPIASSSVPLPDELDYNDPREIDDRLGHQLEAVVDSGIIYPEPSTILDLTERVPRLLRQGKGKIDDIGIVDIVVDQASDDTSD